MESEFAKDIDEIKINEEYIEKIPKFSMVAYLFNPYSILNCVGQTTTVWSNFLLVLFLFGISRRLKFLSCLTLALETQKNFYPFVLMAVAIVSFKSNNKRRFLIDAATLIVLFASCLFVIYYLSFSIVGLWKFVDSTLGFM